LGAIPLNLTINGEERVEEALKPPEAVLNCEGGIEEMRIRVTSP